MPEISSLKYIYLWFFLKIEMIYIFLISLAVQVQLFAQQSLGCVLSWSQFRLQTFFFLDWVIIAVLEPVF